MNSRATDSGPGSAFRYLAICYPFKHKDFTGKIVTIAMIMTYIYGTITNSRVFCRYIQRVIKSHKHVEHDNFENFTKSLKSLIFGV